MATMNVSLPSSLKEYVDKQAAANGFGSSSEYIRELIRRDQSRSELRRLLLEGAESPLVGTADSAFFEDLRRSLSSSQPE